MKEFTLEQKKVILKKLIKKVKLNIKEGEGNVFICHEIEKELWGEKWMYKYIDENTLKKVFPELYKLKEQKTTEDHLTFWFCNNEERLQALKTIKL